MTNTDFNIYNYDVSAGTHTFDKIVLKEGTKITVQIVVADMSHGDSTFEVFQSNDGVHFDNIGVVGNTAKVVLPATTGEGSVTIRLVNLKTNYLLFVYTKVSDTTGTIKYVHLISE